MVHYEFSSNKAPCAGLRFGTVIERARRSVNECGFRKVVYAGDKHMSKAVLLQTSGFCTNGAAAKECSSILEREGFVS